MNSRQELMRKIQILHFNLYDTALYLDTHPMDQTALHYYHKIQEAKEEAESEYNACYGPLTINDVQSENKWTWIEKPWPWEMEA